MRTRFILFIVVFSFVFSGLKAQVNVGDSLALVDLYNATGGKNWTNHTNWLTKSSVSTWFGITVVNNRVSEVYMYQNNLAGAFPSSLGQLDSCKIINLQYSFLTGNIPLEITNLQNLKVLFVNNNNLSGTILPQLGNLGNLTGLDLSNNKFTGNIPIELSRLSHLNYLAFNYNQLSGVIPTELSNLSELTTLSLTGNQFIGNIPSSLGSLHNLTYLNLASNKLKGIIPPALKNLKQLIHLYLSRNNFTGEVPFGLLNLRHLYDLDLSRNELTQTENLFPTNANLRIEQLNLGYNRFIFNGLEYLASTMHIFYNMSPQARISVHTFQNKLAVSAGGTLSNNTYQWYKVGMSNSTLIKGDSTYQPSSTGDYYAVVTNSIVKSLALYTDTIHYTAPLINTKNILSVYISPNPARGMVSIYGLNEKSDAKITIADMSGYVWMSVMSRDKASLQVNVSRLKAGNYLVSMTVGKVMKTVMFVKE